jgi:predicted nucleic acid-binding protein
MAVYFADSSFWIALIDRRDAYHEKAIEWSRNLSGEIVTTQAVLLETANTFARPAWRGKAISMIEHVASRDDVETVVFTESLWGRAWALYSTRSDKAWSLTDCLSFEVMSELRLENALTADLHFRQAGFSALLLDSQT